MPLSKSEVERLLQLVGRTRETEVHCQDCLARVAEFAERRLEGRSIRDGLHAVEHHLAICAECREEYEALRSALDALDCDGAA